MLGPAPIVDFDGTLARLEVPWSALRDRLGLVRLDDLWSGDGAGWAEVAGAEIAAAATASGVAGMLDGLSRCRAFAVLTNNSETSVQVFLDRHPGLAARCAVIAGRETLGGPKQDLRHFSHGFEICVAATTRPRQGQAVIYVGDLPWELTFARTLGAVAIDVVEVEAAYRESQG